MIQQVYRREGMTENLFSKEDVAAQLFPYAHFEALFDFVKRLYGH